MKILITGGGGYLGSALSVALSDTYHVVCLDHGRTYPSLRKLLSRTSDLIVGDMADAEVIDRALNGVDVVIHLAGGGGNKACMNDPVKAVMTYSYGTHLLLQSCLRRNIKRFIFASTVSVYTTHNQRKVPFTEDMALEPDDLYGALKAAAEYDVITSGLNHLILRFSNIYGWGTALHMHDQGGAINHFVRAACNGKPIQILGTGEQGMDYLSIDDAVRCVEQLLTNDSVENEVFNVGSGKMYTIREIAELTSEVGSGILGSSVSIEKRPASAGEVWPDRLLSIEKVSRHISWQPSVELRDGINAMISRYVWTQ